MPTAPHHRPDSRSGGVLLLVLGVMALVLSIVLLGAATLRARAALTRDALRRESARDTLLLAVSNAVDVLLADTNGVDSLDEAWAQPTTFFPEKTPFRALLSDESARLPLAAADTNLLAAALSGADARLSPAQVQRFAADLVRWRDGWAEEHGGEVPPTFAFYARAGEANPLLVERLRAWGTPCGSGRVNVNTAPPEILQAVLIACGADGIAARDMALRADAARAAGATVEILTHTSITALFLGEGVLPSSAEANVLSRAERMLCVSGDRFRGRFQCASPKVSLEFVYDRSEKRFLLWDER